MVTNTGRSPDPFSVYGRPAAVFTPSSPIDTMALFRGRSAQVHLLIETLVHTGQHAIIYGERGVGKTSLASVLYEIISKSVLTKFSFAHVNSDAEDTFASLWRKILRELPVGPTGRAGAPQDPARTRADWLDECVSPDDIRRICVTLDGHLVVIIDEFDQLSGNRETIRLVANTIKTLSDRRTPVTLVLVGVADTVSQLVEEHASVERNLVHVHMPRMSDDEIALIIREGLSSLGIAINAQELAFVSSLARGLPASAHRIGLQLASRMLETRGRVVTPEDINAALLAAIDRMPQSHFLDWQEATQSPTNGSSFEEVLIAAALAPRDRQGWFQGKDIACPFQMVSEGAPGRVPALSQQLHRLSTQRGQVLERARLQGSWRFRFRNPSFQSYVIMRGLSSGRLKREVLTRYRDNLPAEED